MQWLHDRLMTLAEHEYSNATCMWRSILPTWAALVHPHLLVAAQLPLCTQCLWPADPETPQGRKAGLEEGLQEEEVQSAQAWQQTLTCVQSQLWSSLPRSESRFQAVFHSIADLIFSSTTAEHL